LYVGFLVGVRTLNHMVFQQHQPKLSEIVIMGFPRTSLVLLGLVGGLLSSLPASAQQVFESEETRFRLSPVVQGLEHPWGLAQLPDGRFLVTERPGRLRVVNPETGSLSAPLSGLPSVAAQGQGGLLDVALDPAFAENRWVYLTHSVALDGGLTTRVSRGRLEDGGLLDVETLFTAHPVGSTSHHFGSRLAFGADGTLFFTVGDRGERIRAPDPGNDGGKVHRINSDGSIPPNNPFIGQKGASPSVWSLGHRNLQGLAFDPATGRLWETEHGPRGGDEVNLIAKGVNYGWPTITYGREYSGLQVGGGQSEAPGLAQPIIHWTPSIAPSGLAVYDGMAFPAWRGNLFGGALAHTHLRRMVVEGERITHQEVLLDGVVGRVRAVAVGSDGALYLLTDEQEGALYRMDPA
jgi:glucose/arabinose dehydrogenase